MKRLIVGSALGRLALSLRESASLVSAAIKRPEAVGTLANDQMAGFLLCRLCDEGKTFLDIGSHIGSVISEVQRHCPRSRIIAFEAMPEKIAHLRRTFPNVECHSCALSDAEGEATFFVNRKRSGYSSLVRPTENNASDVLEIKVPLKRLDDVLTLTDVDMIKIDVEGAELSVLKGGDRLIQACRPTILFESGPSADGSNDRQTAIWHWFAERDYAILVPNRLAHQDPGLTADGFVESHLYPRRATNYFAVPRERRDAVRDKARKLLAL